jgi:hypothetical protein
MDATSSIGPRSIAYRTDPGFVAGIFSRLKLRCHVLHFRCASASRNIHRKQKKKTTKNKKSKNRKRQGRKTDAKTRPANDVTPVYFLREGLAFFRLAFGFFVSCSDLMACSSADSKFSMKGFTGHAAMSPDSPSRIQLLCTAYNQ